jgi:hypothetical protein
MFPWCVAAFASLRVNSKPRTRWFDVTKGELAWRWVACAVGHTLHSSHSSSGVGMFV